MPSRLDPDAFSKILEKANALDALYVISGDEPLLVTETTDALRQAARKAQFTERSSFVVDSRSDWAEIDGAMQNLSLFGDRRLVEIQIPTGKPGKNGAEALVSLAKRQAEANDDGVSCVVSLPRLDKASRSSKWATALWQSATVIEIPVVPRHDLPQWIGHRLARQKQSTDAETRNWIADRVEGNLLAAHQEIMKLGLLYPEGQLSAQDVERAVLNVARYDVFSLRDAMLTGESARALKVLSGLKAEGEALPLVLWAVAEEIRILSRLSLARRQGRAMGELMRAHRLFGAREAAARRALETVTPAVWAASIQHAHDIDRLIKGLTVNGRLPDPWEELARLVLRIALATSNKPNHSSRHAA
jgi:DNA polymerase-3 subunit delta|tara:strand:- start:117778 stop:118857 length:1080 start_codon:yes stop_codon:yes gene_type:complete